MRLPRDISGDELVKVLSKLGYVKTRQTGSHMRLTTDQRGQHHITVPRHNPLKIGTLGGIVQDVARHFAMTREQLVEKIFGQ